MSRLTFILPLVAVLLLGGVFFVYLDMIRSGEKVIDIVPSALIDRPVPDFDLPPLPGRDGGGLNSATLKGQVSVVNVFASWCIPCRAEHPMIQKLADMGVAAVHGLNWKDGPAAATKWLDDLGDPYAAVGSDESGRVGIEWGVYGAPETFVIGADGVIRYKHVGPVTPDVLEQKILPIIRDLKEPG